MSSVFYEKVGDFNKNWNLQALILLGLEIPRDHLNEKPNPPAMLGRME